MGTGIAYDDGKFIAATFKLNVTPHVGNNDKCSPSIIDGSTTRHVG